MDQLVPSADEEAEILPENKIAPEVEEETAVSESAYIPTITDFANQEPSVAVQPVSGQQIEEAEIAEELEPTRNEEDNESSFAEEVGGIPEEEVEELMVELPEATPEEEAIEEVYTEVTDYVDPTEYETELPAPAEVNSESFIVPEYNPAMEAYAKKPKKEPKKRKKYKKRSFFRRVKEKVTTYLRKLTLKDIRFMDDED